MAPALLRHPAHMRLFTAILALAPALALAQTLDITVSRAGSPTTVLDGGFIGGPADCNLRAVANWSISAPITGCDSLQFWFNDTNNCPDKPTASDKILRSEPTPFAQTGSFQVQLGDLPAFADGGVSCGAQFESTAFLCGASTFNLSGCNFPPNTVLKDTSPPPVTYDGIPPTVPTITHVEPLDASLAVAIDVDDQTISVTVTATDPSGNSIRRDQPRPFGSSVIIDGLQNGVTYSVTVIAVDRAGNQSAASAAQTGTPIATAGFWAQCKADSSCNQSGCSAAGMGGAGLGLLIAASLFFRRRAVR